MALSKKLISAGVFTSLFVCSFVGQESDSTNSSIDTSATYPLNNAHNIPSEYAYFFTRALRVYPELFEVRISLRESNIKTTANARPTLGSLLFRSRKNRHYIIRMNVSQKPGKILFSELDTSARIGLLGHEIGHLYDYHQRCSGKVLARGFSYLTKSSKARFEKEIDRLTIQRGLGIPLYDFSYYVLYQSDAPESYKEFKRTIYLTPEEILELIQHLESK